jgi:hypothetical protein
MSTLVVHIDREISKSDSVISPENYPLRSLVRYSCNVYFDTFKSVLTNSFSVVLIGYHYRSIPNYIYNYYHKVDIFSNKKLQWGVTIAFSISTWCHGIHITNTRIVLPQDCPFCMSWIAPKKNAIFKFKAKIPAISPYCSIVVFIFVGFHITFN